MQQDSPIVGIWSDGSIYGPGAQADTVFVFLPDGTGVLEEWNFVLCCYDLFTWETGSDGVLTITGVKSVTQDGTGQVIDKPSLFRVEQMLFSVAEEDTPKGGVAEVLTIVSNSPKRLLLIEKYGRFTKGRFCQGGSDYQLPTFYEVTSNDTDN